MTGDGKSEAVMSEVSLRISLPNQAPSLPPQPQPQPVSVPLSVTARSGMKYRSYREEDMVSAVNAIAQEGLSMRQASLKYKVPKTTLSVRLGDKRPRLPPRKGGEGRPTVTRYSWTEADMEKALAAIEQDDITSVTEVARQFGVPPRSLSARKQGRAPRGLKGEHSRLTLHQETLLAKWASVQIELGCPPNKDELFALAERVIQKQGASRRLGKQWIQHWMRRYPDLEILDGKQPEAHDKVEKPAQDETAASEEPAA